MGAPLTGVRVLAVEQYGAGPFGTQHLADLGADVIKIENRKLGGDYARGLGPFFVDGVDGDDASLFFQSVNRGKRSLTLDLAHPGAKAIFAKLVASADAVANNLRGDVPAKLGLTYDDLKTHNPAIVCAHCSAYGRKGPRKDWPGYDFLMQAEAGYFHMSGEPETPPTRMGLSVVDFMAGTYMALGLVSAVLGARSSGAGQDIDVNLYDTALYNLSYLSTWALNTDYNPARIARSAHASLVPCQLYRTGDGWVYIMCNKERFWATLCHEIGRDDLMDDPRFAGFPERLKHRETLTAILDDALGQASTAHWLEQLRGKVPMAPIRTPREALQARDLRERGKITETALTGGARYEQLASPIETQAPPQKTACSPMGQDTVAILREVGYSTAEIEAFSKEGLI